MVHGASPVVKPAPLTNVARLRHLLSVVPLDAVIASSPENLAYCSGYHGQDLYMLKERQHFALWTAEGEPAWVAPSYRDADGTFIDDIRHYDYYAREAPVARDALGHVRVDQSPVPALVDALTDRSLARGRIGIEHRHLWPEHLLDLQRRLPHASFVDCALFFETVRMIKTPAEIERLTYAARVSARAIESAFGGVGVGDQPKAIADLLSHFIAHLGARQLRHADVELYRGGRRISVFDLEAAGLALRPGDVIRTDFVGWFDLYLSDLARMAVVGVPSDEVARTYRRLYEGVHRLLLAATRAGLTGAEWFAHARALFESAVEVVPWGMIAHGLGLDIHERPWCHPLEEFVLEPGMVLAVESIYHSPGPMYHVEDLVVIRDDGSPDVITGDLGGAAPARIG